MNTFYAKWPKMKVALQDPKYSNKPTFVWSLVSAGAYSFGNLA